ncbi:nuclear transport factor 2 family protein [Paenibacillus sp. Marseille-Q4541]|uniref:nuclear transport factor 2 family protein n=1 Tax=Paenibacillus sp. Marseille-Q4541 TaxID=2831522 RepID=UPI001BA78963|nr:nuclear transport factor 2 family protein [Paenibacillus sp. Marseille-Q4541]
MEINAVLDGYFQAWNEAFQSKNGDTIRRYMSKDFVGYWAHSKLTISDQYDYSYDVEGVLEQYDDGLKSFEPYSITERQGGENILITGRETSIVNGKPHYAQCMFIWRKEAEEWKLLKEYIELET